MLIKILLFKTALMTTLFSGLMYSKDASFTHKEVIKHLFQIYQDHRYTFFCEQVFSENGKTNNLICDHCPKQSSKVQWISIIPDHTLAKDMLCYNTKICSRQNGQTYKGIGCCKKVDSRFARMSNDMHNLVPEIGEVKSVYRAMRYADVAQPLSYFCQLKLDKKQKIMEPPAHLKGVIARAFLYMRDTYYLPLSVEETQLFLSWHQKDPPSDWEKERNKRIKAIQGNSNPYIAQ